MYSQLKYDARENIKGRVFADFFILLLRFLLEIMAFACLFCFLFAVIKGGYPFYAAVTFLLLCLTAYMLYLFIKVRSEIRFYFPNIRPVHLKRAGIRLYFKFFLTNISVNVLKLLTAAGFLIYPAAILYVLFLRIKNGGVYYASALILFVLSCILILTGICVSYLLNLRFSAADYFILKSRDGSVLLSIKKSRKGMDGSIIKYFCVRLRNIKYDLLSLFIITAPYCAAMKNAVGHEAVLSFISNKKEKAVTFIIDRPGKFSLG